MMIVFPNLFNGWDIFQFWLSFQKKKTTTTKKRTNSQIPFFFKTPQNVVTSSSLFVNMCQNDIV
jgi:hypothetical protein